MKDLLIALYALVALFLGTSSGKEVTQVLKNPNVTRFFGVLPSLKKAIEDAFRGEFDFGPLGAEIRALAISYGKYPNSKVSIKNLLGSFGAWMRTSSETAFKTLEKNSASEVFPPWASAAFIKQVPAQGNLGKQLRSLLQKMTGSPTLDFTTTDDRKQAAEKFPELYAQYRDIFKKFDLSWKIALSNFVRGSGEKTVPYQDVINEFKEKGIDHLLPVGFTGRIDAIGRWYTQFNELMNINPGGAQYPTVRMNPNYEEGSSVWVCQAIQANGVPGQRGYSVASKESNSDEKFSKVSRDFLPIVEKLRKKWLQQLKQFDEKEPTTVACLILEELFQTSARIGGFMSCTKKSYAPISGGFQLNYIGKDSIPTKHKYVGRDPISKHVVQCMVTLAEDKKPNDWLFTYMNDRGEKKRMQEAFVRATFRQLGSPVTVHKLRTYNGTKLFNQQMAKVFEKFKDLSAKDAMKILKEMATNVGKMLNHVRTTSEGITVATPSTALSAYIDASSQVEFFQHYNLPLPKWLERFSKAEESDDMKVESALQRLNAAFDLLSDTGEGSKPDKFKEAKPVTPKPPPPPKPIKPATKPVGTPEGGESAPPAGGTGESAEEESQPIPNAPKYDPSKPTDPDDATSDEDPEELQEDLIREGLGEDARTIIDPLFSGGHLTNAYEVEPGKLENLLVDNRFPPGSERP